MHKADQQSTREVNKLSASCMTLFHIQCCSCENWSFVGKHLSSIFSAPLPFLSCHSQFLFWFWHRLINTHCFLGHSLFANSPPDFSRFEGLCVNECVLNGHWTDGAWQLVQSDKCVWPKPVPWWKKGRQHWLRETIWKEISQLAGDCSK